MKKGYKKIIIISLGMVASIAVCLGTIGITYSYFDRQKVINNENNYPLRIDTAKNTDSNNHKFHGEFSTVAGDWTYSDVSCSMWVQYETLGNVVYMQQYAEWKFVQNGSNYWDYGDIFDSNSDSSSTYVQEGSRNHNCKTMIAGYYVLGYNYGANKVYFKKLS